MLPSSSNKKQYSIAYPFSSTYEIDFKYWLTSEINAELTGGASIVTLVLGVDFSVSAPGDTGTLTKLTDWDHAATTLTIWREVEMEQPTDYRNGEAVDLDLVEQDFDRAVARDQQLQEQIDRIGSTPIGDPSIIGPLPGLSDRADKFAAWNGAGAWIGALGVPSVPATSFAATFLDDLTAAAVRATLAAGSQADIDLLKATTRITAATWSSFLKWTLPPFCPIGIHKGIVAVMGTARHASRTTTSTSAGHLVDSGATFVGDNVTVGDYIYNSTDGTWARVTTRNSQTDLSVDNDVFPTGKAYQVWPSPTWPDNVLEMDGSVISDAQSPINGVKLQDLNGAGPYADVAVSGGRVLRGGTTAGIQQEDQMGGHCHAPYSGWSAYPMTALGGGSAWSTTGGSYLLSTGVTVTSTGPATTDGVNGTPRTGKESRARSLSVVYIMRIK